MLSISNITSRIIMHFTDFFKHERKVCSNVRNEKNGSLYSKRHIKKTMRHMCVKFCILVLDIFQQPKTYSEHTYKQLYIISFFFSYINFKWSNFSGMTDIFIRSGT